MQSQNVTITSRHIVSLLIFGLNKFSLQNLQDTSELMQKERKTIVRLYTKTNFKVYTKIHPSHSYILVHFRITSIDVPSTEGCENQS